tara:strand:- start:22601 stop:23482 length:882 start_codon:yes stop_codon:yes gene_type:complete
MKLSIFSHQKCLNSVPLNILGSQPFRYVLSKTLYWLKNNIFNKKNKNDQENISSEVIKKGYADKRNFLSDEDFTKIKKEFDEAIFEPNVIIEKESYNDSKDLLEAIEHRTLMIDDSVKDKYPALYSLKDNLAIKHIFSNCELKNNIEIFCRLERIKVHNNKIHDNNRDFHYDTFHNTFKAWLFLKDVKEEQGPFHLVPYSHNFSIKRFFSEWWYSIIYALKIITEPSFRIEEGDNDKIRDNYNKKSIKAIVPKNTLVVANAHGLHRRGDAENGSVRESVQFWTRENPFKIFLK